MGVVIDSNILIAWERTGKDISGLVRGIEDETSFLSVISVSELLHGVYRAASPSIRATRSAFVESMLAVLPVLDIDATTARAHARIWSELAQQGQMIGVHDSWIAASCLAHGFKLVTLNEREFRRIPGLEIMNWNI